MVCCLGFFTVIVFECSHRFLLLVPNKSSACIETMVCLFFGCVGFVVVLCTF